MLRGEGHVAHVQHDTFGSGTQDVDWLPEVGAFKEALPAMLRLLRRRATTFVARVTAGANVEIIELHKYARNQG